MPASPGITITLSPGLKDLMARGPAPVVHEAIAKALDYENELTVGAAVRERMSFPRGVPATLEGLRVQTSRLRRSLHRSKARVLPGGVISAIGSNVGYFGVHEFGFDGPVTVRQHDRQLPTRYLLSTGQVTDHKTAARAGFLTKKGTLRAGLGEQLPDRTVTVREHTRQARFPARRMVQLTIEARAPHYAETIRQRVVEALGRTT